MKRIICVVLVLALCLSVVNITALAERRYEAEFSILGTAVDFENDVYSCYDAVYVPLEELCGYLRLGVSRSEDIYTVTRGEESAQVQMGNLLITAGGKEVKMATSPEEYNGITYVPAEFFAKAFGMEVVTSSDKRSAAINPNVFVLGIDINNAAAVSASKPDANTINKSTSGTDPLYKNDSYPNIEKDIYYMVDLSDFAGREIESAKLTLKAKRQEYNPTLAVLRTAPWDSTTICFNNRPQEYSEAVVTSIAKETGVLTHNFNITGFVNNAQMSGEKLSLKLEGRPHSARTTTSTVKYDVQGVNTANAPYVTLVVKENYTFPVKVVEEVNEENTYNELKLLYTLGVFTEEDEFPLDLGDGVQRQEFVRYALRLRNTPANSASGAQFFADVPVDAPFYNDVMTAYSLGLVAGWEGIEFRPYDRITVGEAITILGRMLNYKIYADERGGFTPGYFAAARLGDLYVGAASENQELSFKKMLSLFEDALDAKMLDVQSYTTDGNAKYIFNENMTILSEFWNAKQIEGTVTANEYSNLVPGLDGKEGTIVIDSKELTLNYEAYNQFLGYRVKGWYNDEDVLLYLGTKESSITEIELADIQSVSETASSVSFSYKKDNGNYSNQSFSKASTVIYNGKSIAQSQVNASLLSADGGNIKLVGNNLTIITAYSTIIVYSVQPTEEVIYDRYDAYNKVMRLSGKDYTFRDKDGKDIALDTIKENDVVSAAVSLDGELINAIVSTKKLAGTITTAENLGTKDQILTIGGSEYETRNLTKTADDASAEYWTDYIKLGANGTFLIDAFGYIVGFISTKTTDIRGYVLTMDTVGSSALSKKLQMAVMVRDSEDYVVYDLADKVEIDGTDYKQSSEKDKILAKFQDKETEEFIKQGIIFDLNSEGKVCVIDTAYFDSEKEDEENSLHKRYNITDTRLRYKSNGTVGPVTSGQGGAMFYVYLSKALGVVCYDTNSLDEYKVKASGLANDTGYNFEIYTIGKKTPEAAIVYRESSSSTTSVGDDPHLMLVDKIVTAFDSEGYEIKKLYYYSGTKRSSVTIPDDMVPMLKAKTADSSDEEAYAADPGNSKVIGEISRGDIIRFEADDRGEVQAIEECFDYETKTFVTNDLVNFNALNRTYGGYTGIVNGNYIKITQTADLTDEGTYSWMDSNKFNNFCSYEVFSSGVDVKAATLADVRSVEKVPYNPTGIIIQSAYESLRSNVWLLEMNQPDGTGIYKLSYKTVAPEGSTEPVGGIPESYTRYNPGDWAEVTANVPTTKDYTFKAWVVSGGDGTEYKAGDLVPINGDTVLEPTWVYTPTHTVTFKDAATGKIYTAEWAEKDVNLEPMVHTIPGADSPAATALAKNGYQLIGWKQGTDTYEFGEDYSVTGAVTFEAIWMRNWSRNTAEPALVGNEYQIYTAEELAWFAASGDKTKNVKLMDDIYLNNFADCGDGKQIDETTKNWFDTSANVTAANVWSTKIASFSGTFDGNGKTIYGLYLRGGNGTGLFSSINGGTVKNLNIKGAYLVSTATDRYNSYLSIVCGSANTATFDTITVSGSAEAAENCQLNGFGAIVGRCTGGTLSITNCESYMSVNAEPWGEGLKDLPLTSGNNLGIGGIAGKLESASATITNCANYGNIYAPKTPKVGGIVGYFASGSNSINDCTNEGDITGLGSNVGGLYGVKGSKATLENVNSSSTGTVTKK